MSEPNWDEIARDKEAKKQAVLRHISMKSISAAKSAEEASPAYDDLRAIGEALAGGAKLEADILTGGLANYTYKIRCVVPAAGGGDKTTTTPTTTDGISLFAKLSFPYAQLFPDNHCPLSRTENEYQMMKTFASLSPGCVATPYFCDDLDANQKLLVTQWATVDEQFANQFIDGSVDARVVEQLARGLAALHCHEGVDASFNEEMRPFFQSLTPILDMILNGLCEKSSSPDADQEGSSSTDRVSALAQEYGRDRFTAFFKAYCSRLEASECLVHGDMHAFNILVGAKPKIETLENFDADGNVVLCDWEMSHRNVAGHDLGTIRAFPILCAFAHVVNGHASAALNVLHSLDLMWDEYESRMVKAGNKSGEEMAKIFRDSLLFTGLYCMGSHSLNIHTEFLPIDESNVEDMAKVKESIGIVGLKCFDWGTDETETSIETLRRKFRQLIDDEMSRLDAAKRPTRRARRSSVLRASGRRVSDAQIHFGRIGRLSMISADGDLVRSLAKIDALDVEGNDNYVAKSQ